MIVVSDTFSAKAELQKQYLTSLTLLCLFPSLFTGGPANDCRLMSLALSQS